MPKAYPATGQITKSGPLQNGYGLSVSDTFSTIHEAITAIFSRLQPLKTWALIAETLHLKEHAAKHRAANHRDYSVEELQRLFHSEFGGEALDMMMKNVNPVPSWWGEHKATRTLTYARSLQAASQQLALSVDNAPMEQPTRRKLKRFIDADRNLSAVRAERETAVGDRYQNPDGIMDRDIGRLASAAGRAVAATPGKAQAASTSRVAGGRGR